MPPKALRRPAAKGKALPRPGAGPRRPRIKRPAAAGEADKSFEDFGEVKTSSIPPVTCGRVLFTEVIYWKEATKLVGIIKGLRRENGDLWAEVKVEGTQSEHLLRHLTGVPGRVIRGHLCGEDCSQELASDNVAHLVKAKRMRPEDEVGWMKNLLDSGRDEEDQLDVIRKEAEEARSPSPRRDDTPKERKLKKEAKKDKKKDERRERKRSRTPPALRRGGRDLGVVLCNSGLDPSPQRRRRFLRKAKKMIRKGRKKRQSSSPSGSSKVSSSSSQETSVGAADIFGQSKMAKRIWKKCPGVLTATSLATMQEQLLTAQGQLWDLDKRELPPLFLQFFRGNIGPRMPPAMRREGYASGLLPGPGHTGPHTRAHGRDVTTSEGVGWADEREALDGHVPIRTGSRGDRNRRYAPRDGSCSKRSSRGWKAESTVQPRLRGDSQSRPDARVEERVNREGQGRQGPGKREGLAPSKSGPTRHQARSTSRERKRANKGKVRSHEAVDKSGLPLADLGGEEPPGTMKRSGSVDAFSPAAGEGAAASVSGIFSLIQQSPPSFTQKAKGLEGKKAGPSQEYSPRLERVFTQKFLTSECGGPGRPRG